MIHIIQQSCLEKIPPGAADFKPQYRSSSALCGEEFAYQIVLYSDSDRGESVTVKKDILGRINLYKVMQSPVNWPHYTDDSYPSYLTERPCLLPDALIPLDESKPLTVNRNLTVLWVSITADFPGEYELVIRFSTAEEELSSTFLLHVLPNQLPKQWFRNCQYIDPCSIALQYRIPMFCNLHWDLLEKFFRLAADHGVNNIVTPIFPVSYSGQPKGSEAVQLIRIKAKKSEYIFDYDLLDSWMALAKKSGIEDFTFPPLFPSIETLECPRLVVTRERREELLFGPETDVSAPEFLSFIRQYIRKLRQHLKEIGMEDHVSFQITNAPAVAYEEHYARCRSMVRDVITKYRISDVMVDRAFYDLDLVSAPIVALHELETFLDTSMINREVCLDVGSSADIINFLLASPAVRVRAFGLLCRQYDIVGLFHLWFNHYIAPSGSSVDPFWHTDGENALPSGSGFLVYPTPEGPVPSIRLKQLLYAIQDIRVMEVLERSTRHEKILAMLKKEFPFSLSKLPDDAEKFLALRDQIYERIDRANKV